MKELTKAEEQVMHIFWKIGKGFVKDVIEQFPEPKPIYNSVSTIVRILEKKGFVGYTAYGKTHEYYPLIKKSDYQKFFLKNFVSGYFGGSFKRMVSFFAQEEELDVKELEELVNYVKKNSTPEDHDQ
ncbi:MULTISPECIES: BlaI/MecI/CopY family transcriptional regulator [Rufibacter]|uniref:Putative transcriptional regulator n=1 Tax=Rufibacter quisquiliarum TaxID=1549639 RepID=A0A839GU50_9BACT|nr:MULTISPECIES: BlaI/MecI/CopY family transcriptional regulator [Rufibacter]MBA9078995.1 putative transcriptional regulator [Rufibacter quisquiliarum]